MKCVSSLLVSIHSNNDSPSYQRNPSQVRVNAAFFYPLQDVILQASPLCLLAVANQRLPFLLAPFGHGGQFQRSQSCFQTPMELQVAFRPGHDFLAIFPSVHRRIPCICRFDADICRRGGSPDATVSPGSPARVLLLMASRLWPQASERAENRMLTLDSSAVASHFSNNQDEMA